VFRKRWLCGDLLDGREKPREVAAPAALRDERSAGFERAEQ
jgi:hypothetical protein